MAKYIELKSQIEKLQKEAKVLRKRERTEAIANIKVAIAAFDLTAQDLGLTGGGRSGRKTTNKEVRKSAGVDKRSVVVPKYRDASTGATWTGRGKQPKWLAEALKAGKKQEDFRI